MLRFRYKDDVTLDMSSGRYLVDVKGGVHSLEIPRSASQNDAECFISLFHIISFTFGDSQCQAFFYCLKRCLKDLMATKVFMNIKGHCSHLRVMSQIFTISVL